MNTDVASANREDGRGRQAHSPGEIPALGLKDVFWRLIAEFSSDRVMLVAAGVTYYLLLALFPSLAVLVSIYGLIADPASISGQIGFLAGQLPPGAFDLILTQLKSLASTNTSTLGITFFAGLLLALWSANSGMKSLFDAMNIAYGENEKRGFIKLNLISLAFTLGAALVSVILIVAIGVIPAVLAFLRLDSWTEALIRLVRWPIILAFVGTGIGLLYRYGPSREKANPRWLTWGVVFSTLSWLATSALFSYYLDNFADYNATYGTLGGLMGFLVWIWLSTIIVLLGAELNAELEHQTVKDSTTGAPREVGERGAYVADNVGETAE